MLSLWKFFLEKRQFSILLIGALIIAGTFSLFAIPKESSPEVEIPIGIVTTVLPGASSSDVEKLITDKMEEELANLENIDTLTSTSREGLSVVSVQFLASANLDKSIQDLKDAVDKVKNELPSEATDPQVLRINFADEPVLIISVSSDVPPAAFTALSEDLKAELRAVKGVSKVEISGVQAREVQVIVRSEALSRYGLRLTDVIGALQASNSSLPIGSITQDGIEYAIKFRGEIEAPSEIGNIAVPTQNGIVYIRDIAAVSDGLKRATSLSRTSVEGAPSEQALSLYVFKKSGDNVTEVAQSVKDRLEALKSGLLLGSNVVISFDRGELVMKDLLELTQVGFETVALVMILLFLTIGWREALVAGLSIPLSLLIAFIGLHTSGNTINFVSLFSLILAVGILVDSGIVVTEAIQARIARFGTPMAAAHAAIEEYAWPLIAGTMTTVAVFAPLFFISGITGKFIASIPFTIIFVLIASIIVALGMVPLIAVLFTKQSKNSFEMKQEIYTEHAKEWYRRKLRAFLENRRQQKIFLWTLMGSFVIALLLPVSGLLKVTFFPGGDSDFIYIDLEKPQGTTLRETDLAVRAVEEYLYEDPRIESFVTTIGESSRFSESSSQNPKLANITVNLHKERDYTSTELLSDLKKELSAVQSLDIRIVEPSNGPPTGAPILIKFTGDDLGELESVVDRAERLLTEVPGTSDIQTSMKDDGTQFTLTIDKAKAAQVGLTPAAVGSTLRAAINGTTATVLKRQDKDIDVVVKLDLNPRYRTAEETTETTVDSIRQIPIATPSGTVLLGSVLTITPERANAVIQHEDRKRIGSVSAFLAPGGNARDVKAAFEARLSELELPTSVTYSFGGENEEVDNSFRDMFLALIAGLVLMLSILVLEFNSFRYTLYLLSIVPLSLVGVLGGLALTGQTLSFPSMLGVIALAGVIINHGIILLDSMIHLLKRDANANPMDVVVESASVRLRPIFLTTITTVIGMVPLTFASSLWGPLAFAIMFGLTFATILTLIFIPLMFYRHLSKTQKTI
ncbi:efflux RND transporter permease subunit [Candidatus Parcubacteria bacterium]|nr:efflux RND transporter permease subunit [Candidatus Parcubacteria bacterium]